jgi:hypothetical protein
MQSFGWHKRYTQQNNILKERLVQGRLLVSFPILREAGFG